MRVLVCGSRDWADQVRLEAVLDEFSRTVDAIEVLIEGGARGADRMAAYWAASRRVQAERYPADWGRFGRSAGHIRNKTMLRLGNPDAVIAFHRDASRGTADMIELARAAEIPVYVVTAEGVPA